VEVLGARARAQALGSYLVTTGDQTPSHIACDTFYALFPLGEVKARMLKHARRKLGVVALLGFGACSDNTSSTATVVGEGEFTARLAKQPGQEVAAGIASALANPAVRRSVLQAFRSSPWVEHKLVLQQFIATSAGTELVAAAASARGVTAAEFANLISALPLLDFYVPSRAERLSWRGENTVGVSLSTSMNVMPSWAHTSDGKAIRFASAHAVGRVLFLLHPAEAKGRRMQRQAALVGSTIQDGDDGDVGVQFIHKLGVGDSVVYDLQQNAGGKWAIMDADGRPGKELATVVRERVAAARLDGRISKEPRFRADECDPYPIIPCDNSGGTGGGNPIGPGYQQPTNVTRIQTRDVCDLECGAGNEFEFRASALNANNVVVMQGTARITGVECCAIAGAAWTGSVPMLYTTVASGVTIRVSIVETDQWNPDDNFDPDPVLAVAGDNGRRFQAGPSRSGYACIDAPSNPCLALAVDFGW
jgi:hypothetical protein